MEGGLSGPPFFMRTTPIKPQRLKKKRKKRMKERKKSQR